jgi:hypothetical protein
VLVVFRGKAHADEVWRERVPQNYPGPVVFAFNLVPARIGAATAKINSDSNGA